MSRSQKPQRPAALTTIALFGCAALHIGCASIGTDHEDPARVAMMLQSAYLSHTLQYDRAVRAFAISPEQARTVANEYAQNVGMLDTIFEEPSMVIDGNYLFASKHKTRRLLRGVLVNGRTGDAALLKTDLAIVD